MPAAATVIARARGSRSCNGWPTTCASGFTSRISRRAPASGTRSSIRLFCHITENWRGRALHTFETVVALIGHTRTAAGLRVKAKLDTRRYPTGCVVTHAEMRALALHAHPFHGDWNYELRPRPS